MLSVSFFFFQQSYSASVVVLLQFCIMLFFSKSEDFLKVSDYDLVSAPVCKEVKVNRNTQGPGDKRESQKSGITEKSMDSTESPCSRSETLEETHTYVTIVVVTLLTKSSIVDIWTRSHSVERKYGGRCSPEREEAAIDVCRPASQSNPLLRRRHLDGDSTTGKFCWVISGKSLKDKGCCFIRIL